MKKPTNATRPKAATPKVGAAPAKTAPEATATSATASTASEAAAAADQAGKVVVDAAAIVAASEAAGTAQTEAPAETGEGETIDIEAIRKAAYDEGYSEGFSEALDANATTLSGDGEFEPGPVTFTDSANQASDDRARLVALALFTPENQRKGGISPVVNRLQSFLDGLPPGDRWPALQFMTVIGQTKPIDLASGRYEHSVREGLAALNGDADASRVSDSSVNSAAAAARFAEMFPEDPADAPEGAQGGDDPDLDISDPSDAKAAAARLASL